MTFAVGLAGFAIVAVLFVSGELVARASQGRFATLPEVVRWLRTRPFFRMALLVSWGFCGVHWFMR